MVLTYWFSRQNFKIQGFLWILLPNYFVFWMNFIVYGSEKDIKTVEQACMTTAFKVLLDNNQLAYGYWAISETENLLFSVYDIN